MKTKHHGFEKLASFTSMPFEDAQERYKLDETDDVAPDGFNIAIEDIFGEPPEQVFRHEGSVSVAGDVRCGAVGEYAGVYIIEGDLEVKGLLEFTQVDGGAVLLVTGTLRAKNLSVSEEAQLWVGKNLEVSDYVLANVSDAGGLAVKGSTTAKAIIVTDSETLSFGKKPKARVIERVEGTLDEDSYKKVETTENALAPPFNTEDVNHDALVKRIIKGRPILQDR